jgi:hypothetical protein
LVAYIGVKTYILLIRNDILLSSIFKILLVVLFKFVRLSTRISLCRFARVRILPSDFVSAGKREHWNPDTLISRCPHRFSHSALQDYDPAIEAFQKALTEHRNPDTLKKLNDAEKAQKQKLQEEYFDPEKAEEERQLGERCPQASDVD